ncbi:MAG: hypothetical protein ACU0DH_04925 [Paracoccus sp. (in: a-proteobacteria)]|uniref:hypothetical protein n=1 Tax=Paracoccus sp. TaxID=267 RepID=UPI0040585DA5
MTWLARALAGPMLWGALFSAVYALHGAGCNLGWMQVSLGPVDLHHGAMWAVWAAGLAVHVLLVVTMPAGQGGRAGSSSQAAGSAWWPAPSRSFP